MDKGHCEEKSFNILKEAIKFIKDNINLIGLKEDETSEPVYITMDWVDYRKDCNVNHAELWSSREDSVEDLLKLLDTGYYAVYGSKNNPLVKVWVSPEGEIVNLTTYTTREHNKFLKSKGLL